VQSSEDQRLVGPPWGFTDFVMVMLGSLAGGLVGQAFTLMGEFSVGAQVAILTLGTSLGFLGGLALVTARRNAKLSDLGLDIEPSDGRYLLYGGVLQVALALIFAPLAEMAGSDGTTQVVADRISTVTELGLRVAIILLVGLAVPVVEELAFRGVLLKAFQRRLGDRASVLASSVVFSLLHWDGIDSGNVAAGLITLAQLTIVGAVLGALVIRHRRLGPAIFLHAGFNVLTLMVLFFAPEILG
jgi:uncharacterized protein